MGVYYELGTLLGPKNTLPTLAALVAIYFAFTRLRLVGKMIICAWLRLSKIIFFRDLIKHLIHNHPHITTIPVSTFKLTYYF